MAQKVSTAENNEFLDRFRELCGHRGPWEVWNDFVNIGAIMIANSMSSPQRATREQDYLAIIKKYDVSGQTALTQLIASVINTLEENPWQDFLGDMFMRLNLGSNWGGQFFTPYTIAQLTAQLQMDNIETKIEKEGWVAVNDSTCGAGALLIGYAEACKKAGINYQEHIWFVAQDIDRTAALMCYIQLSLLGCPGYVVIADTLAGPLPTGPILLPPPKENIWITPFFHSSAWAERMFKSASRATFL